MGSLNTVGTNARADAIAKKLGFRSAEELKEDYVANIAQWDMKYDVKTKEIVLQNHNTGEIEPTDLYIPDGV